MTDQIAHLRTLLAEYATGIAHVPDMIAVDRVWLANLDRALPRLLDVAEAADRAMLCFKHPDGGELIKGLRPEIRVLSDALAALKEEP